MPARTATLDAQAVSGTRDSKGALRTGMDRGGVNREWRFHDEMQPAIRPDKQRKILTLLARSRHIEDSLCIFKQGVHLKHLSAGTPALHKIPEENSNHRDARIV
jgi:hypothetical protein